MAWITIIIILIVWMLMLIPQSTRVPITRLTWRLSRKMDPLRGPHRMWLSIIIIQTWYTPTIIHPTKCIRTIISFHIYISRLISWMWIWMRSICWILSQLPVDRRPIEKAHACFTCKPIIRSSKNWAQMRRALRVLPGTCSVRMWFTEILVSIRHCCCYFC